MGLAMTKEDLKFCRNYFKEEEGRDPYETEIRVLDTYWSDHCRHTTFETELKDISIPSDRFGETLQKSLDHYHRDKRKTGQNRKTPYTDGSGYNHREKTQKEWTSG